MTELSDRLLIAYVDGQLSRDQKRAVEKVLEQDDVTAAREKTLQEGHSRLEAAFEAILTGEMDELSGQTVGLTNSPQRAGFLRAGLGVAGIVILLIAIASSYGGLPVIPYRATSGMTATVATPDGNSKSDRTPLIPETPSIDPVAPIPAAEAAPLKQVGDEALHPKTGTGELVTNEQRPARGNTHAVDAQLGPGNIDFGSKRADSEITGAVDVDNNSEPDRVSPLLAAPNPAGEAESNARPLRWVAGNEALPQDGGGERLTGQRQHKDNASDVHSNSNNIGPDAKLSGAETGVGVPASDPHSAMLSQADRALPPTENPITSTPDENAPNPAAEAPDGNSNTLPKRVAGDETLHPKTGARGFVPKEAKAELPTEQLNVAHSQQPMALAATKNEEASPSAKKPVGRKVKPAAPGSRSGAKLKTTAPKSRSKPFTLETAGALSPEKVSNRRTSASDHATKVRQALGRHKAGSVGTSGSVTVSFAIGASGALRNARISRSSGKPQLDQAALAIVRKTAPFPRPARGGQPAYTITINFR